MHKTELNDLELISEIMQDHIGAFDILFLRYYRKLCNYANTITLKKELSEEVVQDLFVKIWENRKKLIIEKSVNSYLYRSVFNLSANAVRDNRKFTNQVNLHNVPIEKESYDNADNDLLFNELELRLFKVIDSFSEIQRSVFILKRFDGLTYKEISKELNVSERMVERHLNNSLISLREELTKINQPIPVYFFIFF